jgi:hypothetical protein
VSSPQIVEQAQRLSSEPAQFRVMPLALQLSDDHKWQHHLVLIESAECPGVG